MKLNLGIVKLFKAGYSALLFLTSGMNHLLHLSMRNIFILFIFHSNGKCIHGSLVTEDKSSSNSSNGSKAQTIDEQEPDEPEQAAEVEDSKEPEQFKAAADGNKDEHGAAADDIELEQTAATPDGKGATRTGAATALNVSGAGDDPSGSDGSEPESVDQQDFPARQAFIFFI